MIVISISKNYIFLDLEIEQLIFLIYITLQNRYNKNEKHFIILLLFLIKKNII